MDMRSVSFADREERHSTSEEDEFDGGRSSNGGSDADSWMTSSTVSMSATSHAWIQDLVRLSMKLPKWRAILFLIRRIGNNVPPKSINIFAMAITFSALPTDVKDRLVDLGIKSHLELVNLIIVSRLVFAFLLGTLIVSIVLICVFTMRDVDRGAIATLEFMFWVDAICVVIFTLEILFHINSIPSKQDRQKLAGDRSGAKSPYPTYPWFTLLIRPKLKQSTSTIATLAILDTMRPTASPTVEPDHDTSTNLRANGEVQVTMPSDAASRTATMNAQFAAIAPPIAAAAEAGGMIKHHSLADPGWWWLAFDILATFPFYFEVSFAIWYTYNDGNGFTGVIKNMYGWTGLPPAIWILRLFRVFRVFKFMEKSEKTGEYLDPDGIWRYRSDDSFSPFQSVPDTLYDLMRVAPYGDVTPRTLAGRLVACVIMFCSIFIIAFPLSMITMQYAHVVRTFADRSRRQDELTYRLHHRLITRGGAETPEQETPPPSPIARKKEVLDKLKPNELQEPDRIDVEIDEPELVEVKRSLSPDQQTAEDVEMSEIQHFPDEKEDVPEIHDSPEEEKMQVDDDAIVEKTDSSNENDGQPESSLETTRSERSENGTLMMYGSSFGSLSNMLRMRAPHLQQRLHSLHVQGPDDPDRRSPSPNGVRASVSSSPSSHTQRLSRPSIATTASRGRHHHHSSSSLANHAHHSLSIREVDRAFEAVRDHETVPVVHIRVADWRAEYREDRREDVLNMRIRVRDEEQYRRLIRMLQEFQ
ncbi:hypothetical protein HDU67_009103 [Dinochytrium kinnereticum]|nr:hypothetical protein HDU67_009103 [Dinochytrium kinnereticum]